MSPFPFHPRYCPPRRYFRCGLCVDEGGEGAYTWAQLLRHRHGKRVYWEIEE